jgi:hypothetical protein
MLAPNVFQTTYKDGVRVIVNYNNWEVQVDGYELEALGYRIALGGAQ